MSGNWLWQDFHKNKAFEFPFEEGKYIFTFLKCNEKQLRTNIVQTDTLIPPSVL